MNESAYMLSRSERGSMYYILSLKHSEKHVVFWRPNDAGYTYDLSHAGVYSQDQIDARPAYYNNGETAMAVPVRTLDSLVRQYVPMEAVQTLVTV